MKKTFFFHFSDDDDEVEGEEDEDDSDELSDDEGMYLVSVFTYFFRYLFTFFVSIQLFVYFFRG